MDLLTYITEPHQRAALAAAANTSPDYLWQVATGWRNKKPSPSMAMAIECATNGVLTCEQLRPDLDWTRDASGRAFYRERIQQQQAA